MSPDSPHPSRQRRAWRAMSAAGVVIASFALFLSAFLFTRLDDTVSRAVCTAARGYDNAAVRESELASTDPQHAGAHAYSAVTLRRLAADQRALVSCPPDR